MQSRSLYQYFPLLVILVVACLTRFHSKTFQHFQLILNIYASFCLYPLHKMEGIKHVSNQWQKQTFIKMEGNANKWSNQQIKVNWNFLFNFEFIIIQFLSTLIHRKSSRIDHVDRVQGKQCMEMPNKYQIQWSVDGFEAKQQETAKSPKI